MDWKEKNQIEAPFGKGEDMVMSNRYQTYLNLKYAISPLRFFYNWDPIPDSLSQEFYNSVIGVEAPIWTEPIPTYEILGTHIFPRLFATAEVSWSQKHQKDYKDFKQRIPNMLTYLDMVEMPYLSIKDVDPNTWQRMKKPLDILLLLGMHVFFFFSGY